MKTYWINRKMEKVDLYTVEVSYFKNIMYYVYYKSAVENNIYLKKYYLPNLDHFCEARGLKLSDIIKEGSKPFMSEGVMKVWDKETNEDVIMN